MNVVVSRYQENIDWADGIENGIIYNKGPTTPVSRHPVITLPNVGREGHTYLYHIIQNYDQLPDHTCFLQGHPFDHTPDLEHRLQTFDRSLSFFSLSNPPPRSFDDDAREKGKAERKRGSKVG